MSAKKNGIVVIVLVLTRMKASFQGYFGLRSFYMESRGLSRLHSRYVRLNGYIFVFLMSPSSRYSSANYEHNVGESHWIQCISKGKTLCVRCN